MDHICMVIPVTSGKSAAARAFLQQLDGAKRSDYDASERRIGITKEVWFLAAGAAGDQLVGYMESADFGRALTSFVGSRDPFDLWFKEQMHAVTGVDLNNPPATLAPAELLSAYAAGATAPV
jgi:hypothetical protein